MVESYTQFKGVRNIGDTLLSNELENNMKSYLDWCLLGIGGYVNVYRPTTSSFDGGGFHVLRAADDPSFTARTVWETIRKDWVWESGVSFTGTQPISISGVYVNSQLFGTGDATYGHSYDYPNGRVIFNNAIPAGSGVTMNYSYRFVQTHVADNAPWFFEGQYESLLPASTQWTGSPSSGDFSTVPEHRIQFPCVIVEAVAKGGHKGYELGNSALWVERDILFHVVSDTKWGRNKLVDIIDLEHHHEILLYNTNLVVSAGYAPLNISGMLVQPSGTYPYLVENFYFQKCFFKETKIATVESPNPRLHEGNVRATLELVLGKI